MEHSKQDCRNQLWYKEPATIWEEALPIGNGRLGGMVFGGIEQEVIQLNEDTLWSGFPRDTANYEALRYMESAKTLAINGKYTEAEAIVENHMVGRRTESYQPLGELRINMQSNTSAVDYRRELDLDTAIASVSYIQEGIRIVREVFASNPDNLLVIHIRAEEVESGNNQGRRALLPDISAELFSPHPFKSRQESGIIILNGSAPAHVADNYMGDHPKAVLYEKGLGLLFAACMEVHTDDGEVERNNNGFIARGAKSVSIFMTAATNFAGYDVMPGVDELHAIATCVETLHAASTEYHVLRNRHIRDYRALYERVKLNLGSKNVSDRADVPTNERLERYRIEGNDTGLETTLFHYGRYLMIAGSRPGSQALNLQGIWNPHIQPPWNSNYTTNINTEMNYWPSEICRLGECHEPLLELIRDLSITGSRTASLHYGCQGWVAHHNTDLWRMSSPSDGRAMWAFWPMGGVWLSRHLWERYAFRPDETYLRDTAYPILKGAALFCIDWLVELPEGMLTTGLSTSPENVFLTSEGQACSLSIGSAMDMSLIAELFSHCILAEDILNEDTDFHEQLINMRERLYHPGIGSDGRLREWHEDFIESEQGHRHISHLYDVYPGSRYSNNTTPDLIEAAKKSLQIRLEGGSGHTGWSAAWLINLYARLGEHEQAYSYVRRILTHSTLPNLLGNHPPFQIDGNFGVTAGIAEMLLQSHQGEIHLLPSLPNSWSEGEVQGLVARGGFIVDIGWRDGLLMQARVTSTHGQPCTIYYDNPILIIKPDGVIVEAEGTFNTRTDDIYIITSK